MQERKKWGYLERQKKGHLSDVAQDELPLCPVLAKLWSHRCGGPRPWGSHDLGEDREAGPGST